MIRTHIGVACKRHGYTTDLTAHGQCKRCAEEEECKRTTLPIGRFNPFTPWLYEDISETPVYVTSKSQLIRECKKHGVKACRLD